MRGFKLYLILKLIFIISCSVTAIREFIQSIIVIMDLFPRNLLIYIDFSLY